MTPPYINLDPSAIYGTFASEVIYVHLWWKPQAGTLSKWQGPRNILSNMHAGVMNQLRKSSPSHKLKSFSCHVQVCHPPQRWSHPAWKLQQWDSNMPSVWAGSPIWSSAEGGRVTISLQMIHWTLQPACLRQSPSRASGTRRAGSTEPQMRPVRWQLKTNQLFLGASQHDRVKRE